MTKKLFSLAIAFVLMALPCACKENPVIEEKTVSAKQEMVYGCAKPTKNRGAEQK